MCEQGNLNFTSFHVSSNTLLLGFFPTIPSVKLYLISPGAVKNLQTKKQVANRIWPTGHCSFPKIIFSDCFHFYNTHKKLFSKAESNRMSAVRGQVIDISDAAVPFHE